MIGLTIPSYPDPFNPGANLANAYGWISFEALDGTSGNGSFTLSIFPSSAACQAGAPPLAQRNYRLGQVLVPANPGATPPVAQVAVPSYAQLFSLPANLAAMGTIMGALLSAILPDPALAGATIASN